MENFSNIENIAKTGRDQLITEMVSSTGLSLERVEKLYESFSYANNGDLKKINESFVDFINPESTLKNFENFQKAITSLSERISAGGLNVDEKNNITDSMLKAVETYCGISPDMPSLLEVVCYILLLKDNKFQKISNSLEFGKKTSDLFENQKIDFSKTNVLKTNLSEDNNFNANENIRLYESLKIILARNNKNWGYTYHLDNAYQAIVKYLDEEIVELTNAKNINTVSDNFHMELLNQIVTGFQLNPMYRSVDVLRTLIPDIQTLVFDCMLLVHEYISRNQYTMQFIARETYIGYISATKTLFAGISSSQLTSKIIGEPVVWNDPNGVSSDLIPQSDYEQIFNKLRIDGAKLDIYTYQLNVKSVVDMLHIIKSCETEFNLNLRKVINNYFTKAMNLVASTDHQILEQRKTNKYKNSY